MNTREKYNEYMRSYNKERYKKLKQEFIEKLGGKCVKCGSINNLQFDHINRDDKSFTITKSLMMDIKKLEKELEKCQLLCKSCHELKTIVDLNKNNAKTMHGTLSSYRYCKCDLCRKANAEYSKKYYYK